MPGTIIFRPIEANLTHNTEWIGRMDPYCVFHVGSHKIKGQVCKKGGKHPHWEDSITVPIEDQNVCSVQLKEKDLLIDDNIGTFDVDLREIESMGTVKKWYPIFYKGKPAGEILMEALFTGTNQGMNPSATGFPTTSSTSTTGFQQQGGMAPVQNASGYPTPSYQATPFNNSANSFLGRGEGVESYAKDALLQGVNPLNVITTDPRLNEPVDNLNNLGTNVGTNLRNDSNLTNDYRGNNAMNYGDNTMPVSDHGIRPLRELHAESDTLHVQHTGQLDQVPKFQGYNIPDNRHSNA